LDQIDTYFLILFLAISNEFNKDILLLRIFEAFLSFVLIIKQAKRFYYGD